MEIKREGGEEEIERDRWSTASHMKLLPPLQVGTRGLNMGPWILLYMCSTRYATARPQLIKELRLRGRASEVPSDIYMTPGIPLCHSFQTPW